MRNGGEGGSGAAGADDPTPTEMPNSRHCPFTGANDRSKLTWVGTEGKKPAIRIRPLASICGSRLSCGSITATPERSRLSLRSLAKISPSRAAVLDLKAGRADIAQHGVIAGLVGVIERKQRRPDQDQHAVAIDLRGLGGGWAFAPARGIRMQPRPPPAREHRSDSPATAFWRSPREGHAGPSADAALRKAGGDAAIDDDIFAQPHLGAQAHGILAAEGAPVGRDREFLV